MKCVRRIEFVQQLKYYAVGDLAVKLKECPYLDSNESFAYIVHDKDLNEKGELKEKHFHCVMRFNKPVQLQTIANFFGAKVESFQLPKNRDNGIWRYLLHLDNKEKHLYSYDELVTNWSDIELFKKFIESPLKVSSKIWLDNLLNKIYKGELSISHIDEVIALCPTYLDFINNKSKIESAYQDYLLSVKEKNIEVIFVVGDSGTGKTSFAKKYAVENGLTYCISASENDLLNDYKGEDCLILDDLRHYNIDFVDFLKLCDNNTRSSFKSRYYNKKFVGSTIIITTTEPFNSWYISDSIKEQRLQFIRRINRIYNIKGVFFDKENNAHFTFDVLENVNNNFIDIDNLF